MLKNQNHVVQNSSKLFHKIYLSFAIIFIFTSFTSISTNDGKTRISFEEKNKLELFKKNGKIFLIDSIYGKILLQNFDNNSTDSCMNLTYNAWVLDYYKAVKGKVLGIWPYDYSIPFLRLLKEKWGYNGLWLFHDSIYYSNAIHAGFNKQNLMVSLDHSPGEFTYTNFVDEYESGYYYIDEVAEHNCIGDTNERIYNPTELNEISSYIYKSRPGAKFVISGYKRCKHLSMASVYANLIMYSSYHNWYRPVIPAFCDSRLNWGPRIETLWFKSNYDQRDSWSDMKKRFGEKFQRTWIKTNEESEYQQLFGHAVNIGLNSIWVYGYEDIEKEGPYDEISYVAFINVFLKKFEKQIEVKFFCEEIDKCNCDLFSKDIKINYQIIETGMKREVFP